MYACMHACMYVCMYVNVHQNKKKERMCIIGIFRYVYMNV